MDLKSLTPALIALAGLYAIAHFVENSQVKAAAYGAMGVVVAKKLPFFKDAL